MSSREESSRSIGPGLAAFVSSLISVIVTVAATLVSFRSGAGEEHIFPILLWILFVTSGVACIVAIWILASGVKRDLWTLRHLREYEAYVPRLIRFRRRSDSFFISEQGDALLRIECEVVTDGSVPVPWISFPMLAEVSQDRQPWTSVVVRHVRVDGQEFDPRSAYLRKSRRTVEDDDYLAGRIVEEGVIRVPVSLDEMRRRCDFFVELELRGAFENIFTQEMCYTDVSYVTEDLTVVIRGTGGLRIESDPYVQYRVEAQQLGMELVDIPESQLQTRRCRVGDGVVWRSQDTKLGYRYRVSVRGVAGGQVGGEGVKLGAEAK